MNLDWGGECEGWDGVGYMCLFQYMIHCITRNGKYRISNTSLIANRSQNTRGSSKLNWKCRWSASSTKSISCCCKRFCLVLVASGLPSTSLPTVKCLQHCTPCALFSCNLASKHWNQKGWFSQTNIIINQSSGNAFTNSSVRRCWNVLKLIEKW